MPISEINDKHGSLDSAGGSSGNLFLDAYNCGKKQLTANTGETVTAAVVGAAATGALIYMSRGRSLAAAVKSGAVESERVLPEARTLLAEKLPTFPNSQLTDLGPAKIHSVVTESSMVADSKAVLGMNTVPDSLHSAGELPLAWQSAKVGEHRYIPHDVSLPPAPAVDGPIMRAIDGPARIVFAADNSVQQILFPRGATRVEMEELRLQAGYASLIKSDVLAAEAVSKVSGQSIGFVSQPIERYASLEEMQENALIGARAYIRNDAAAANRFTQYLTERYGPADFIERAQAASTIH